MAVQRLYGQAGGCMEAQMGSAGVSAHGGAGGGLSRRPSLAQARDWDRARDQGLGIADLVH